MTSGGIGQPGMWNWRASQNVLLTAPQHRPVAVQSRRLKPVRLAGVFSATRGAGLGNCAFLRRPNGDYGLGRLRRRGSEARGCGNGATAK